MHTKGYYICGDCYDRYTSCPVRLRTGDSGTSSSQTSDLIREYPRLYRLYRGSAALLLIFIGFNLGKLLISLSSEDSPGVGYEEWHDEHPRWPHDRWTDRSRRGYEAAPAVPQMKGRPRRAAAAIWYFRDL